MYLSNVKTALFVDQISDHLSHSKDLLLSILCKVVSLIFVGVNCGFSENHVFKDM